MDWVPDLRQLRAFVAVVEEGSFTLAARRIFVTQSAVSHSLRTLEEQLSCRLLDRSGKRVAVTAEGELLLKRCKRVIEAGDTTVMLDRLAGSDLDLVVGLKPRGKSEDGYRPMFNDRLAFVVSPFHPWAVDPTSLLSSIN